MPLVRIDVQRAVARRAAAARGRGAGGMLEVFAAPPRDRYQVITEHRSATSSPRTPGSASSARDGVMVVQIFQQGRSDEQKKAAYAALAERLEAECGVAPTDLIVSVRPTSARTGRSGWVGRSSSRAICDRPSSH